MNQIKEFWDKSNVGKLVFALGVLGILFLCGFSIFLVLNKSAAPEPRETSPISTQANAPALTEAAPPPTKPPKASTTKTNMPAPTATMTPLPGPIVLQ
jgi:hypothetical protein